MDTITKTLYSANPDEYPNLDIQCKVVDDMETYVMNLLAEMEARGQYPETAKKTATVRAHEGQIGEEVDTRVRTYVDDKEYFLSETKNKVSVEGSMIVTNPDGEEYIVKPDKFAVRYQETDTPGVYLPVAEPIKYIICPENITFKAPWGEEMVAVKGAALNITCLQEIYAIQNAAFEKTYSKINSPVKNQEQVM